MILIITNKEDFTADYVIYKMRKKNIPYIRFNTETFPYESSIIWDIKNNLNTEFILKNNKKFTVEDISGIWYRRPKSPEFPINLNKNIIEFVTDEVKNMFSGIWRSINAVWVSHPDSIRNCSSKIDQMKLAYEFGLSIPDTLITNNVKKAKEFIDRYNEVLVKPLYKNHFSTDSNEKILYSNILTKKNYKYIDLVQNCPLIFQNYIEKKYDIRINLIGDELFATEIHSQNESLGKIQYDCARAL
jgi:glutathione synthase/RimK-type ligase-like ATP-grasp enzyme